MRNDGAMANGRSPDIWTPASQRPKDALAVRAVREYCKYCKKTAVACIKIHPGSIKFAKQIFYFATFKAMFICIYYIRSFQENSGKKDSVVC
jgi:hypothetical protein